MALAMEASKALLISSVPFSRQWSGTTMTNFLFRWLRDPFGLPAGLPLLLFLNAIDSTSWIDKPYGDLGIETPYNCSPIN